MDECTGANPYSILPESKALREMSPMDRKVGSHRMDEFRVAFKLQPSEFVLVSANEPLAPFKSPGRASATASPASDTFSSPGAAPRSTQVIGPPPEPKPIDPWQTEVGRQVRSEEAQIRGALQALRTSIEETRKHQADRLDQLQKAAVELALTIATKLLHQQIERDEFPIESMVRDMSDQLLDDVPSVVRLNPDDLLLLERRLGNEPLLSGIDDEPRLVPDASLARGDCRVEGKAGSLRISELPQHLEQIREDLLGRMGHVGS